MSSGLKLMTACIVLCCSDHYLKSVDTNLSSLKSLSVTANLHYLVASVLRPAPVCPTQPPQPAITLPALASTWTSWKPRSAAKQGFWRGDVVPDSNTIQKQAAAGQLAGSCAVGAHEPRHFATPGRPSGRARTWLRWVCALAMLASTTAASNSVRPQYIIAFCANTTVCTSKPCI